MENASMNEGDRHAMMKSMMEQFFSGLGADEKKEMFRSMMGKMCEGMDMTDMAPMMMGMMSGGGGMQAMMGKMMEGGAGGQMPEMMLKQMMPNCIGMMLPSIDAEKRGEIAATILSALVEKGTAGLSDEQAKAFRKTLNDALNP